MGSWRARPRPRQSSHAQGSGNVGYVEVGVLWISAGLAFVAPTLATQWEVLAVRIFALSFLANLATIPTILLSSKTPQGKSGWILVVLGMPGLGAALYWIGGRSRLKRRVQRLRHVRSAGVQDTERRFHEALLQHHGTGLAPGLVRTAEVLGGFPPYPGNDVRLLIEGPAALASAIEAIDAARDHVHLETYLIRADRTGRAVVSALARAATRGVSVRLLYDSLGSYGTSRKLFRPLRRAGGRVAAFLPVGPCHPGMRVNLRNHRKLLIVDGNVAFTGGRNIANEYAASDGWRDIQVRIAGSAALGLQRTFLEDWQFATGDDLAAPVYFEPAALAGSVPVQVISSGPDQDVRQIEELFFASIANARTRVDIMTPYFLPPEPLRAALFAAVLRGIPVRLLVPAKTDHAPIRLAMEGVLPQLMSAGLQVWACPTMLHGKVLVVDDEWATLGSANMDARSLRLNFELNVAFPHRPTARALRCLIDREIAASRPLTLEELRVGVLGSLLRNAAGLFAPIL